MREHSTVYIDGRNGSAVADLRFPWIPDSAEFSVTPGGFSYLNLGRVYRLHTDSRRGVGGEVWGTLEAYVDGAYCLRGPLDWASAAEREEAATVLARGDEDLKRQVRGDLYAFRMAVTLLRAEANVEPIHELLVTGLDVKAMRTVASIARKLGGRTFRRASA